MIGSGRARAGAPQWWSAPKGHGSRGWVRLRGSAGSSLGDLEIDDALTHLLTSVCANARDAEAAQVTQLEEEGDDQRWWESVKDLLAEVLDPNTYPLASRIGSAAGTARGSAHDPQHAYHFGLSRIIESFESLTQTDRI